MTEIGLKLNQNCTKNSKIDLKYIYIMNGPRQGKSGQKWTKVGVKIDP